MIGNLKKKVQIAHLYWEKNMLATILVFIPREQLAINKQTNK